VTPEAAIQQAKTGALLPVYLVTGTEQWLRDEVVSELRAAALGGGVAAFNEDRFTAGDAGVDVDRVIAAARTVPMMANRRFVLVRAAERWDTGGASDEDDGKRAAPLDRLLQYVTAPVDSTCLVVVATKIDGRRKLATTAKKDGFNVACEPLDSRRLSAWVIAQAKRRGHAIDPDVANLLAEIGGPELAYLDDALERLSLYVGKGAPITEDAVGVCVARVRGADSWALVAAVGERNLAKALMILADAYDPRDRGLPLLGAIAWSVRQLARLEAALEAGMGQEEAARAAGIYPSFKVRELSARLKGLRPRELERWLLVVAETDVALKSSRRPPDAILEDMLVRLCTRAA
jgi:DNA polymerase-3 subunit delta